MVSARRSRGLLRPTTPAAAFSCARQCEATTSATDRARMRSKAKAGLERASALSSSNESISDVTLKIGLSVRDGYRERDILPGNRDWKSFLSFCANSPQCHADARADTSSMDSRRSRCVPTQTVAPSVVRLWILRERGISSALSKK